MPKINAEGVTLATGPAPVPVRLTVCGLPVRLSAMPIEAVRVKGAVGVNVTWMAQLVPCAKELPQLFVSKKSPALAPVMLMLVMLKLAFPVLERVTLCPALVVPTF